jgi:hypothetical protein
MFATLQSPTAAAEVVVRFCRRRIDRTLKKINLSGPKSVGELIAEYSSDRKPGCRRPRRGSNSKDSGRIGMWGLA